MNKGRIHEWINGAPRRVASRRGGENRFLQLDASSIQGTLGSWLIVSGKRDSGVQKVGSGVVEEYLPIKRRLGRVPRMPR